MESPPPDFLNWAFWFKDSTSVRDLLLSLVAVVGIPFLIWRELSTHRSAKAAFNQSKISAEQVKLAAEQVKISAKQSEIAARRHEEQTLADQNKRIADNFSKAAELLGNEKLEARLGAIYTLERIAHESKDYHWPIMETLAAYTTSRLPSRIFDENIDIDDAQRKLPIDITAVIKVLGRRNQEYDIKSYYINLVGSNLNCFNFINISFQRTNLSQSDLTESWLAGVNLAGSLLIGAKLNKVRMRSVDLTGADLNWADLSGAVLEKVNLTRATLRGAKLSDVEFEDVIFCKTIMPDGTVNNRDCPSKPTPPSSSETVPTPN